MSEETSPLLLERRGALAFLRFNRPARRHAINFEMMRMLDVHLKTLESASEVRCVILGSTGAGVFVSGGDLRELRVLRTHEEALSMTQQMGGLLRRLERLDAVVLAAIDGLAIGGGCEIALAADQRFVSAEGALIFRQVQLGLLCGWGGLTRLERLVGRARAFSILAREPHVTPERALGLGLVEEVVPSERLMERVEQVGEELCRLPPLALRGLKRGLLRIPEISFEQAQDYEAELFARTWASEDHWEALDAFQGGRTPNLKGR